MKCKEKNLEICDFQVNKGEKSREMSNFHPAISEMKIREHHQMTWKDICPQVIVSCIAFLIVINVGMNLAYNTVLIDGLRNPNKNSIKINKNEESWIASLAIITVPMGSLLLGPLMDKFGRKSLCIVACLMMIISSIFFITASSVIMIYAGRIMAGFACGMSTVSVYYVIEITHPRIRSMIVCFNSVAASLGILLVYFQTLFFGWQEMAIVFLILNIIFLCLLFFIPESPYWLICFDNFSPMSNKRIELAEKCLKRLNPRWIFYDEEYERIKETNEKRRENLHLNYEEKNTITTMKNFCKATAKPAVYKPLILILCIFLMQQLSGIYIVISYAIQILKDMLGTSKIANYQYRFVVFIGVVRFVMSIATVFLSKKIGRRTLLKTSGIGMAISMFSIAMLMQFYPSDAAEKSQDITPQEIIQMIIILIYICMGSLGFAVLPWFLSGELLPISFRGIGGGFTMSITYVMMFFLTKSYQFLTEISGTKNIFFFFSLFSLIGTAFVHVFLPETLGKSFTEIEKYFEKSKSRKNDEVETHG